MDTSNPDTREESPTSEFAEMANVAMERIAEHAITHPMRTLGIAAGIGYTLGRGLPTFVVRLGMLFGARMVTNALVSASLEKLGGSARRDEEEDALDAREVESRTNGRTTNGRDRRRAAAS